MKNRPKFHIQDYVAYYNDYANENIGIVLHYKWDSSHQQWSYQVEFLTISSPKNKQQRLLRDQDWLLEEQLVLIQIDTKKLHRISAKQRKKQKLN